MDSENRYGVLSVQKKLLALIKEFDTFCTANGIFYSLEGGSLLGAIRHNGFIPWDDDIDILMDRKNHDLLIQKIKDCKELRLIQKYWINRIVYTHAIDNSMMIDIMVLDNVPNSIFMSTIKMWLIKLLQGLMKPKPRYDKAGLLMKIALYSLHHIGRIFPYALKFKWYHKVSQMGNGKVVRNMAIYNNMYQYLHLKFKPDLLDNLIRHQFEDTNLYIMADFDYYLRAIYGDYMIPPAEQNRKPLHRSINNSDKSLD